MIGLLAKNFFASSPVLGYAIAALLLFLVVFSVVAVRALRARSDHLEHLARLPFEVEEMQDE